ncbi:PAS domain S-box protein [bacterium]|nr:PAS domain S-box protein [bacterium]
MSRNGTEADLNKHIDFDTQRYRRLLDVLPEAVSEHDAEGRFLYASPASVSIFAHDEDTLLKKSLIDLAAPEQREQILQAITEAISTGQKTSVFYHLKSSDRKVKWVESSFQATEENTVAALTRKRTPRPCTFDSTHPCTRDEVLELNARLISMIESPRFSSIVMLDLKGRIASYNANFETAIKDILRVDVQPGDDLFSMIPKPQLANRFRDHFEQAVRGEYTTGEFLVELSGSEYHYNVALNPVTIDDDVIGVTLYIQDTSKQVLLEQEFREKAESYSLLLNGVDEGIGISDAEENLIFVNPAGARIFGMEQDELVGQSLLNFVTPESEQAIREQTLLRTQDIRSSYELEIVRADGEHRTLLITASPQKMDTGETRTFGVFRDITDQRLTERELAAAGERFRNVFEHANDAMALISMKTQKIIEANGIFCEWSGYTPDELKELRPEDLSPPDHHDDIAKIRQILVSEGHHSFDLRLLSKEGQVYLLEGSATLIELQGEQAILVVARDVSERRQAQEALRASEKRFRGVIENSPAGVCIVDEEGLIEYANPAFCRMLEFDPESLEGEAFVSLFPNTLDQCEEDKKAQSDFLSHVIMFARGGTEKRMLFDTAEIVGLDGHTRSAVFVIDITARKNAEEALQHSEQRLKVLFELSPDAIFTADVATGKLIDANTAACNLTGYTREEMRQMNQVDFSPGGSQDVTFYDFAQGKYEEASPIDAKLLCKDGKIIPIEIRARMIQIQGKAQMLASFRDMSARYREQELNRFQSQLMNAVHQAVIATDRRGRITYWNGYAERMFGWKAREVMGKLITRIKPERPHPGKTFAITRHLKPGQTWSGEVTLQRRDGTEIPVLASTSPVYDRVGKMIGTLGVTTDITGRKEYERQLQQARQTAEEASAAKSTFLANMSHEIRTPMNSILGFSELLYSSTDDPQQQEYLDAVRVSANSLMQLINDILDLSRIEAGRMQMNPKPVQIRPMLADIRNIFQQNATRKGLDFNVIVEDAVPDSIILDDIRLRQILINLVGNAVKFTERGFVHVSLRTQPHEQGNGFISLQLTVTDSGPGIPANEQEKIFQAFVQVEKQDQRKYGGTGLGLAITHRLVDMMNGSIILNSHPGAGATFTVILPDLQYRTSGETGDHLATTGRQAIHLAPARILLMEDEVFNRRLIREFLKDQPVEIVEAVNGAEGLAEARHQRPDLILLDLRMPVMDGYETLQKLQLESNLSGIPVIVLSASLLEQEESRALDSGAKMFLRKPLSRPQLVEAMSRYLRTVNSDPA